MTKFLNISTDNTLGGASPNDETVSSQKAIKDYIDTVREWYGECATAAATKAKVVTCTGFSLRTGVSIRVKFTNGQTYSGAPTLNVNSTGAISVYLVDGTAGIRYSWQPGEVVAFTYDGTYWIMEDGGIAGTSYYGVTKLSTSSASTSSSLASTPYALNRAFERTVSGYASFSSSSTYAVGDRVRYSDGYMYECTTAVTTAGDWNASDWTVLPDLQTQINDKVDKVTDNWKVYATNGSGNQTSVSYSSNATSNSLAYRSTGGVLTVGTPTADAHAATKKYVDDGLSAKADSSSLATVATSGSYNDLSNKPTIPTVDQTYDSTSTNAQSGTAVASAVSNKVDKNSSAQAKAYGTTSAGVETTWKVSSSAGASTLAYRGTNGVLQVGTPTADEHAATKKYVDDSIPTVNDATITFTQGGVTKGSITLNQSSAQTIALDAGGSGGSSNIPYGTSDSAADATEKTVSIPEITALNVGQIIIVQPSITSTVANSTLKLNNFTAYPMIYNGGAITTSTDSQVWSANFPTTWRFDGTNWVFLAHGIDNNTTYTLNYSVDAGQYTAGSGTYAITRYSLIMQKADMTWEKITATNKSYSTATTKSVNTNGFRLNQIRYYSTTAILANGALSATNVVYSQAASVDMRYSTNCGGTTTWALGDYIYLVGTLGLDGLFYLDTTTWWTNTLPNTKDGKLYIRLGLALADNGYTMSFFADRPIFYHDGTSIREYNPAQGYHPDLFDHKWADHILNDAQWLRADTFSWQNGSMYQAAYQHLADDIDGKTLQSETIGSTTVQFYLADDGHKICPDTEESNVAAIYTATGVAYYYIIDTVNQRFKLPRTKFGFTGIRTGVGNYVEPTAPNITAFMSGVHRESSGTVTGAFTTSNPGIVRHTQTSSGMNVQPFDVTFSASNSSGVYQDGATIQQSATEQYLYFYVGNFTQTAIENTAGLNASLFNGKADVDLTNAASNASATAKEAIVGWGMPSDTNYDTLTLGASGTQYTAPADGYFLLYAQYNSGSNTFFDMYVVGSSLGYRHWFGTADVQGAGRGFVPVKKGQKIQIDINGSLKGVDFKFVYADGE